jgi:hypothetical protein
MRPNGIDKLNVPPNRCCGRLTQRSGARNYICSGPCGNRYDREGKVLGEPLLGVDIDAIHFTRGAVKPGVKPCRSPRA